MGRLFLIEELSYQNLPYDVVSSIKGIKTHQFDGHETCMSPICKLQNSQAKKHHESMRINAQFGFFFTSALVYVLSVLLNSTAPRPFSHFLDYPDKKKRLSPSIEFSQSEQIQSDTTSAFLK